MTEKGKWIALGQRLERMMASAGVNSARALALRTKGGVSAGTIGPVLNGDHRPGRDKLLLLADALGQSPADLLSAAHYDQEVARLEALMEDLPHGRRALAASARELAGRTLPALVCALRKLEDEGLRSLFEQDLAGQAALPPRDRRRVTGILQALRAFRGAARGPFAPPDRRALRRTIAEALRALEARWKPTDEGDLAWTLVEDYVLGLAYFEVLAHLPRVLDAPWLRRIDPALAEAACATSSHVEGFDGAFRLHDAFVVELMHQFPPEDEAPWRLFAETLAHGASGTDDDLPAAVRRAVTLRMPRSSTTAGALPAAATAAQLAHWLGYGGDGLLFEPMETSTSALLRALHRYRGHSFDWHAKRTHRRSNHHFTGMQEHFKAASRSLALHASRCTAALLVDPVLAAGRASEREINVRFWADAVGPKASAEERLETALGKLAPSAALSFRGVLTEVSPIFVSELFANEDVNRWTADLVWRDLNRPFPGERSAPENAELSALLAPGTYDVYSCSVALHQVADRDVGRDRLEKIIAFASRLVRPGGVLSLPDVGPGAFLQVFMLPMNLVDREGGWGATSLLDTYPIWNVAVPSEGRSAPGGPGHDLYKVPVPLLELRRGTPAVLDARRAGEGGESMYEYVPYVVVELPRGRVEELHADWCDAVSVEERSRVAAAALDDWRPGASGATERVLARLATLQP
jgi:transcriptional regulator with XRE-family HTH domain/SAM-dependent methyltransferase